MAENTPNTLALRLFDVLKDFTATSYSLKRVQDSLEKEIQEGKITRESLKAYTSLISDLLDNKLNKRWVTITEVSNKISEFTE